MKQLIQHEQCQRCRECCRFREDRQYFAPIFTEMELAAIQEVRPEMPEFRPFKGSDKVFQIVLTKSQDENSVYPYVCPFLDEEAYSCTIYDRRPFDCRTWPFLLQKVTQTGTSLLAHFTGDVCLALDEVSPEDFDDYKAYFQALVTSEKYVQFLKHNPELLWEHEEDGEYHTVPMQDMTDLLRE